MSKSGPTASTAISAGEPRRMPDAPEGSAASGKALGEVARLSPDEALQRLSSTAGGLTPNQVKERLRSVGTESSRSPGAPYDPRRARRPLDQPVERCSCSSLATASYFLGDQRAAIVIAVMVVLSISLGFIQEHRSNNAADKLQRMVLDNRDRASAGRCRGA